jgi:hypothetical protein
MAESGPNWKLILAVTAAVVGLGAAAVIYIKKIKERGGDTGEVVDDLLEFVRSRTSELDRLISEAGSAT